MKELPERFNELGSFIREQRSSARLSLRRLSELAGISNPYLSQIERGLRRPSAEILQQIAKALRISAETLYVQAGILEKPGRRHRPVPRTSSPTATSPRSSARRMMRIYLSFRHENEDLADGRAGWPTTPAGTTAGRREPAVDRRRHGRGGPAPVAAGRPPQPAEHGLPVGSAPHEASGRAFPAHLAPGPTRAPGTAAA